MPFTNNAYLERLEYLKAYMKRPVYCAVCLKRMNYGSIWKHIKNRHIWHADSRTPNTRLYYKSSIY